MSDPSASPVALGTILAGKYRVDRVLGEGRIGVVVEAHHLVFDERVALELLRPQLAAHPEASARFLHAARAAVRIKSAHVARVSDVGTLDGGAPYMVLEYLDGRDLSVVLRAEGPRSVADAVDYILQACDAVAEAHAAGIIHGDLEPANLFLVRRSSGAPFIKVLDFGISQVSETVDDLTGTTAVYGSALHMSPEQIRQSRSVDHRTDVYTLGVTLYELLTCKQPHSAATLPELCLAVLTGTPTPIRAFRADVPEGLAAVLERAYARDREQRPASIGELVTALAPYAPPRSQVVIDSVARLTALGAPRPRP